MSDTLTREETYEAKRIAVRALRDEGYSLRQIGRAMDMSHEWVRKLLFQAVNP